MPIRQMAVTPIANTISSLVSQMVSWEIVRWEDNIAKSILSEEHQDLHGLTTANAHCKWLLEMSIGMTMLFIGQISGCPTYLLKPEGHCSSFSRSCSYRRKGVWSARLLLCMLEGIYIGLALITGILRKVGCVQWTGLFLMCLFFVVLISLRTCGLHG